MVSIRYSENIKVFGSGGNVTPWPKSSVFLIEHSSDILLAGLFTSTRQHKGGMDRFGGLMVEQDLWHMLIERFTDGTEFNTLPLQQPVVYKRGETTDVW